MHILKNPPTKKDYNTKNGFLDNKIDTEYPDVNRIIDEENKFQEIDINDIKIVDKEFVSLEIDDKVYRFNHKYYNDLISIKEEFNIFISERGVLKIENKNIIGCLMCLCN